MEDNTTISKYTYEELIQLISDADKWFSTIFGTPIKFKTLNNKYPHLSKRDMRDNITKELIKLIVNKPDYGIALKVAFEHPLEKMPSFKNRPDGIGLIANWRINIGR